MIPVLIVPVLNRPELLLEMLGSLDHPVEKTIIIDNGDVTLGWHRIEKAGRVIQPGYNLGCSASWNLGMKVTPKAPWWLIVNSDLTFGPGDLDRTVEMVGDAPAKLFLIYGFSAFVITRATLAAVGYFDENIHPAYDEDLDYARRSDLLGLPRVEIGFSGTHVGSATIHSDASYRQQNGRTHAANDAYYAAKWGGQKQGSETFDTPFGRGGNMGEWRLDPERLRQQGWE